MTGKVDITFCHTHQNHELQLGHLRIQPSTRQNIAAQLQQGVHINRIMDNIREDISQGINRDHLITKQDVRNIQHCYNIEGISHHANDLASVCSWVKELIMRRERVKIKNGNLSLVAFKKKKPRAAAENRTQGLLL